MGTSSPTSPDAKTPPENAVSLSLSGCGEVDLRPRLLNSVPSLRSINVTKTARMVVAPRIYDSRVKGNGESAELDYIEVSQVCDKLILICIAFKSNFTFRSTNSPCSETLSRASPSPAAFG